MTRGMASVMKPGLEPLAWIELPPFWQAASMRAAISEL